MSRLIWYLLGFVSPSVALAASLMVCVAFCHVSSGGQLDAYDEFGLLVYTPPLDVCHSGSLFTLLFLRLDA